MRHAPRLLIAACLLAAALSPLSAADWPGWRGPDRTGVSAEKGLLPAWPKGGPKLLWTSDKAGLGFAGMAVVGDAVYTMGARGDAEYLIALDAKGGEAWATKIGPVHDWKANSWSRGPNATPTVEGELVYGLGSKGDLLCANRKTGKKVWSLNLPDKLSAEVNPVGGGVENLGWGFSWSPLIDGDKLVVVPGGPKGLFAALDKKTGDLLWQSKAVTDQATYSSPVVATIGKVKQYVYLTQKGVVGVSAADGSPLWSWKRDDEYPDFVCPTPIVKGDHVYVSVGRGGESTLLKVTETGGKFAAAVAYDEKVIANVHGGVVRVGKYVYGYHEDANWACQEFESGKIAWPKRRVKQGLAAGGLVAADGKLFALDEAGQVGLLEASPKGFKLLGSFDLPRASKRRKSGAKVWTHPSLSDGKLYLRDQEFVFCYQVK